MPRVQRWWAEPTLLRLLAEGNQVADGAAAQGAEVVAAFEDAHYAAVAVAVGEGGESAGHFAEAGFGEFYVGKRIIQMRVEAGVVARGEIE